MLHVAGVYSPQLLHSGTSGEYPVLYLSVLLLMEISLVSSLGL